MQVTFGLQTAFHHQPASHFGGFSQTIQLKNAERQQQGSHLGDD
jgi:hypothetical protein